MSENVIPSNLDQRVTISAAKLVQLSNAQGQPMGVFREESKWNGLIEYRMAVPPSRDRYDCVLSEAVRRSMLDKRIILFKGGSDRVGMLDMDMIYDVFGIGNREPLQAGIFGMDSELNCLLSIKLAEPAGGAQ